MPVGLALFALLILVPTAEIALFIQVGGFIGVWPTIALILLTAALGSVIIRIQGVAVLQRARKQLDQNVAPVAEVFDGACLLIAGVLLLTPGFATDAAGGLLLIPPLRAVLYGRLRQRLEMRAAQAQSGGGQAGPTGPTVIDVEYEEIDDDRPPPPPRGGWDRRT